MSKAPSVLCLFVALLDPYFLPHKIPLYRQKIYMFHPLKELKMVNRLYIARIELALEPIPEGFQLGLVAFST